MSHILLCKSCENHQKCKLKNDHSFIDRCPKITKLSEERIEKSNQLISSNKKNPKILEDSTEFNKEIKDSISKSMSSTEFQQIESNKIEFKIIYKIQEANSKKKRRTNENENKLNLSRQIIPYNDISDYEHGKSNIWNLNKGYNISNKNGTRRGRCQICDGTLRWDSKHAQSVCEKCFSIS